MGVKISVQLESRYESEDILTLVFDEEDTLICSASLILARACC